MGDELRLIGGKQAIHTHTQTANCEPLMDITKSYGLDRIWINAEVAERLGIADGDEVILSNTMAEGPIKVKVTERINRRPSTCPPIMAANPPISTRLTAWA